MSGTSASMTYSMDALPPSRPLMTAYPKRDLEFEESIDDSNVLFVKRFITWHDSNRSCRCWGKL